jgi:transposase
MYCGIDWAGRSHAVCVVDEAGEVVDAFSVPHTRAGLTGLVERLGRLAGEPVAVAIERADGVLVERLAGAGHPVVPIHPNAFAARRASWGSSGAKDDPRDAYRLADLLRTDHRRLRVRVEVDPALDELQALERLREDHLAQRIAAVNRLEATLALHWPGAAAIFGRLDSPIALDFLERYPTPERARGLGPARMAAFCRRHSYAGRRTPQELLERLHAAPAPAGRLGEETVRELVLAQVRLVRALLGTLADLERAMAAQLPFVPQARALASLPRIGQISLAQVVGELGPLMGRCSGPDALAALIGAVPVTRRSGQQHGVSFRFAAAKGARRALSIWADNSRHASPWAAEVYARARARGKRHPHAVRILMRAWLRVIWAIWHSGEPYDPARHGGARRLIEGVGLT